MFRILTEDVNETKTLEIVSRYFPGFTAYHALGYWEGKPEASLIVEVSTYDRVSVMEVAREIRIYNNQTSVLVQDIPSTDTFVTKKGSERIENENSIHW